MNNNTRQSLPAGDQAELHGGRPTRGGTNSLIRFLSRDVVLTLVFAFLAGIILTGIERGCTALHHVQRFEAHDVAGVPVQGVRIIVGETPVGVTDVDGVVECTPTSGICACIECATRKQLPLLVGPDGAKTRLYAINVDKAQSTIKLTIGQ